MANALERDHDVIDHADINQRQGVFQSARDSLIGAAGLCHTGRMVVEQQQRSGVELERALHHDTWIHASAIDRALK